MNTLHNNINLSRAMSPFHATQNTPGWFSVCSVSMEKG